MKLLIAVIFNKNHLTLNWINLIHFVVMKLSSHSTTEIWIQLEIERQNHDLWAIKCELHAKVQEEMLVVLRNTRHHTHGIE